MTPIENFPNTPEDVAVGMGDESSDTVSRRARLVELDRELSNELQLLNPFDEIAKATPEEYDYAVASAALDGNTQCMDQIRRHGLESPRIAEWYRLSNDLRL
jgi:hypothetical protein